MSRETRLLLFAFCYEAFLKPRVDKNRGATLAKVWRTKNFEKRLLFFGFFRSKTTFNIRLQSTFILLMMFSSCLRQHYSKKSSANPNKRRFSIFLPTSQIIFLEACLSFCLSVYSFFLSLCVCHSYYLSFSACHS